MYQPLPRRLSAPSCALFALFAGVAAGVSSPAARAATLPSLSGINLVAHYAGDQVQTTGTDVDVWDNQGTGGATLDAGVVTNNPTFVSSVAAINNRPVVRFAGDGQDTHLRTGTLGSAVSQPFTIYHVGLARTVSNNPYWYDGATGSNRVAYLHRNGANPNEPDQFAGTEASGGGTAPTNSFNIWTAKFDSPAGSELRLNGSLFLATGNVGSSSFEGFTIGARFSDTQEIDADIAEIALLAGTLRTSDRQILDNHYSAKYNIALAEGDVYAGDSGANGDRDLDVFGIGRVDSSNITSGSSLAGLGLASSTLEDGEFVTAGHNQESNSLVSAVGEGNTVQSGQRSDRVWFLDVTSGNGVETTISLDLSDAGLGGPGSDSFSILFSESSNFQWTVLTRANDVTGDLITFDPILLTGLDDGFIALGVNILAVPEPATGGAAGFAALGLVVARRRRACRAKRVR